MNSPKIDMITFHGWGFSPGIWNGWQRLLPDHVSLRNASRGYFTEPKIPEFKDSYGKRVIVTHSFGLHWCPRSLIEQADLLVVLSGFLHFHSREGDKKRRSQLILRQMMSRFVEKPEEVLHDFYEKVFHPAPKPEVPEREFDHDRLLSDLEQIDSAVLTPEALSGVSSIALIHGDSDQIVSRQRAREIYSMHLPAARYFEVKGGGHAVGLVRAAECIRFLNPLLNQEPAEESE